MSAKKPLDQKSGGFFVYGALTLLCTLLYLPGIVLLPPTDRDEARFMQASKQMIETADYGHIRFQAEPRDKKPIGAHWAQVAAVKLFGQDLTTPWPYRIPSFIGVVTAVLVTAWSTSRALNPTAGAVAGIVLATTLLTTVEAHLAKADALLFGASAVVLAGFLRAYTSQTVEPALRYGFWIALGASVLVKGPILPLVLLLTLAALFIADKRISLAPLQPVVGLPLTLLVILIWPAVVGWDEVMRFGQAAFTEDLLPKLMSAQETHGGPPGAHTLASIATLWPWSLVLPIAAIAAWRDRASPVVRVCAAWIIPFWLVLELTPTKLPHYVLPVFPAIAMLIAAALSNWTIKRALTVGVGGPIAALAGVFIVVNTFNLPGWTDLNLARRLSGAVQPYRADHNVVLVGYAEPSAVFLLGTDTFTTNADHAAQLLTATPGTVAAIEQADVGNVETSVTAAGYAFVKLDEVSGYNYSRGRNVNLIIATARANSLP
ncbi:MAG: glycosyltransferase family 39 protein [Rhodospirillaceae bacterium]|nr:glycosyltransferase family 39 protein [Rhodospirillaceae bacterium]